MGQRIRYTVLRTRQKGALTMSYEIRYVHGHVEIYDQTGRFCCSGDTEGEALAELEELAAA